MGRAAPRFRNRRADAEFIRDGERGRALRAPSFGLSDDHDGQRGEPRDRRASRQHDDPRRRGVRWCRACARTKITLAPAIRGRISRSTWKTRPRSPRSTGRIFQRRAARLRIDWAAGPARGRLYRDYRQEGADLHLRRQRDRRPGDGCADRREQFHLRQRRSRRAALAQERTRARAARIGERERHIRDARHLLRANRDRARAAARPRPRRSAAIPRWSFSGSTIPTSRSIIAASARKPTSTRSRSATRTSPASAMRSRSLGSPTAPT